MKNIILNNGVKMPVIGFGTYQITDAKICEKSVIAAIEAGYRLIDTAQAYGNEEYVGQGIKESGVKREQIFITTKVWFHCYKSGECRKSVIESMQKLKVDYLDLVLLHWPFGDTYAAWRDLEKLYEERKIRAIGISNFDMSRMIDFIHFNKVLPAVNQIETNLFCQRKEESLWLKKYNVAHQAYAPLGQGKVNEILSNACVESIAKAHGKTPAQIALKFLIQNGIAVIPKTVHDDRMKENIDIFDFELTEKEMCALSDIDTKTATIGNAENPEKAEFAMTW